MPEITAEPIDWTPYVEAHVPHFINNVADKRGYRREFVKRLQAAGYLGRYPDEPYKGWCAFPVRDLSGVIAVHLVNREEKSFAYAPTGITVRPFTIGDLAAAERIHIFESQWDMFAVMDRLGTDPGRVPAGTSFVSTRGASNVAGLDERLADWLQGCEARVGGPRCRPTPRAI